MGRVVRAGGVALFVYGGLIALTYVGFARTPTGFIPAQDKQYLVSFAQLPDAATLDRTEAVIRRMGEIALKQPGVDHAVAFPGLSINGFTNSPNSGIVFVTLKPFEERKSKDAVRRRHRRGAQSAVRRDPGSLHRGVPAAACHGLGHDRRISHADRGSGRLGLRGTLQADAEPDGEGQSDARRCKAFSPSYQVNVPQIDAEVDREKAKSQGVSVQELFDTMQVYLGSLYVNDFNAFGRTYPVNCPGRARFSAAGRRCRQAQDPQCRGRHDPVGILRDRQALLGS